MSFTCNLMLNLYSILLLTVVYLHSIKNHEIDSMQSKLFMWILRVTILMIFIDILSRFDGNPNTTIYPIINQIGNFLSFLSNPILPSFWLSYVHYHVFKDGEKTKKLFYPLIAVILINGIMVVLNQYFEWFYYIDSNNIYHRGRLFLLSTLITIILLIISFGLIIFNHKKIERRFYFSLVFFSITPFISILIQIFFYGISITLNSVAISLLIVFLDVQNQNIYTDFLTGVNNRKKLDICLKEKIASSTKDKTFSAIMIDLDNFKSINDTYGHNTGDSALQFATKIISSCLRSSDNIFRFGGDEFCIVLDISDSSELELIVNRINDYLDEYNGSNEQPYKLGFSMGYAIYDYNLQMNVQEFLRHIDMLMYEKKYSTKNI